MRILVLVSLLQRGRKGAAETIDAAAENDHAWIFSFTLERKHSYMPCHIAVELIFLSDWTAVSERYPLDCPHLVLVGISAMAPETCG